MTAVHSKQTSQFNRGFTLIELMLVVAIIGVISAIAVPSYQKYIEDAHRAEARTALLQAGQALERIYSVEGQYVYSDLDALIAELPESYTLGPSSLASSAVFTLTATRKGRMLDDSCGNYSLTDVGILSHTLTPSDGTKCL